MQFQCRFFVDRGALLPIIPVLLLKINYVLHADSQNVKCQSEIRVGIISFAYHKIVNIISPSKKLLNIKKEDEKCNILLNNIIRA